jgi:hypothetical protein
MINNLRASYGSQRLTKLMNPLRTIGRYFSKFHCNINLPFVLTHAKQSVVFNKDMEIPVSHN